MATTTNYSWTTPDDTALVKDGAAAIRTLGSSIDTTVKNLNPETTTGAISYRGATANQKTALPIGTAGQLLAVNSGATAPEWKTVSLTMASASNTVATSQTSTSTSFTDLSTVGPSVTLTTGTKALVIISSTFAVSASGTTAYMDFAISGATTRNAANTTALQFEQVSDTNRDLGASRATLVTLTAGSNVFTAKYRISGSGTGTWADREIIVIDLGS